MSKLAAFAAVEPQDVFKAWGAPKSTFWQTNIVLGFILLIGIVVFVWIAFFRRRRKRKHHHRDYIKTTPAREHRHSSHSRRRRRRRRPEFQQRNPTLAETGGLPPVRPENKPPPSV